MMTTRKTWVWLIIMVGWVLTVGYGIYKCDQGCTNQIRVDRHQRLKKTAAYNHNCPIDKVKVVAWDEGLHTYTLYVCGKRYYYRGVDLRYGEAARFELDRDKQDTEKQK